MVRIKLHVLSNTRWVVDDGDYRNGRVADSVKTNGKVEEAHTADGWLIMPMCYLSFVGNHAIIHPNPTLITRALNETPLKGVDDGS